MRKFEFLTARRALLTMATTLVATTLGTVGTLPPSLAMTGVANAATKIVQCDGGTDTSGDIQTSSLSVTRVPTAAPTPGGCTVGSG